MRELIASLPAAVAYLSGPNLLIDFANDACFRLVGDRGLVGRPLREALPELAEQGEVEKLIRILQTGEPVRGSEARVWFCRSGQGEQPAPLRTSTPSRRDRSTPCGSTRCPRPDH